MQILVHWSSLSQTLVLEWGFLRIPAIVEVGSSQQLSPTSGSAQL